MTKTEGTYLLQLQLRRENITTGCALYLVSSVGEKGTCLRKLIHLPNGGTIYILVQVTFTNIQVTLYDLILTNKST